MGQGIGVRARGRGHQTGKSGFEGVTCKGLFDECLLGEATRKGVCAPRFVGRLAALGSLGNSSNRTAAALALLGE